MILCNSAMARSGWPATTSCRLIEAQRVGRDHLADGKADVDRPLVPWVVRGRPAGICLGLHLAQAPQALPLAERELVTQLPCVLRRKVVLANVIQHLHDLVEHEHARQRIGHAGQGRHHLVGCRVGALVVVAQEFDLDQFGQGADGQRAVPRVIDDRLELRRGPGIVGGIDPLFGLQQRQMPALRRRETGGCLPQLPHEPHEARVIDRMDLIGLPEPLRRRRGTG